MLRLISFLVVNFLMISGTAQAARMSDIVKKEFVVEGEAAVDIITFLGFSPDIDGVYQLPWKKDSSVCGSTLCDPTIRINTLSYKAGQKPKIVITGYWYDGETGALPDVPKYSFQSPYIDSNELFDWNKIVTKHNQVLSSGNKRVEIMTDSTPLIRIASYAFEGHVTYYFGIDNRSPELRKIADEEYKKCLEKLRRSGLDSSC